MSWKHCAERAIEADDALASVLDGVCQCGGDAVPAFIEVGKPADDEMHALLQSLIAWLIVLLTRRGVLVAEMGQTYLAEPDADEARTLRPVLAAATYRIAFGPRAGRKVLPLRGAMPRQSPLRQPLCSDMRRCATRRTTAST